MKLSSWISRFFLKPLAAVSQVLLAGCTVLAFVAIIMRYFFNSPIAWSDELLIVALVLLVMMPQGQLESNNEQLCMTALYSAVSRKWKFGMEAVRLIITVGMGIYFAIASFSVIKRNIAFGASTATLHIPYWIIYISIAIAFITMVIGRCIAFQRFVREEDADD